MQNGAEVPKGTSPGVYTVTDPPKGTGPGVYTVTDPPKGTGPGVYTVTNPFGTGTVPKTGPAFLEADRERIDGTVSRSRVNKRPIRHDFWIETIWNRSRVNIALRPIYTTENFWHGSGEYGTRTKKIGSARINFTV